MRLFQVSLESSPAGAVRAYALLGGGILVTSGLWMAALNGERRVPNPALRDAIRVTPSVSADGGGIAATGTF